MPDQQNKDTDFFNVTVYGSYFIAGAAGNVVKPFGPVTLKMRTWENCQKMTMFFIVPALLQKADMQYQSVRRCTIISIKTADDKEVYGLPLRYMSKEQIAMECRSQHIPLRVEMYPDILQLRKKLRSARFDKDDFIKKEQRNIKAFSKLDDTLDLNAGIFEKIKEQNSQEKAADLTTEQLPQLGQAAPAQAHISDRVAFAEDNKRTSIGSRPTLTDDLPISDEELPVVTITEEKKPDEDYEVTL